MSRDFTRASRTQPCPACGKTDWCMAFTDGRVWCGRRESDTPCEKGGYMHWPGGRPDDWREQLAALPPPPPRPVYDPDILNAVYSALLARCPLSDKHRAELLRKGYAAADIERAGHGTLPKGPAERARIVAEVEAETGIALCGEIPGFHHGPLGATVAAVAEPGRLLPVRDRQGRIVGLRFRIDGATESKYRWLSGWPGGAGIDGGTVHHAIPPRDHGAGFVGIVEGEDKANVAAARLGFPMLAIAGISLQANIAQAVRESGARYAAIYFDRDEKPETKAAVEAAEARLARTLADECPGLTVLQAVWPAEAGKGLDDCLLSGLVPFTVAHPAVAASSEAAIVSFEEARRAREEAGLVNRIVGNPRLGGDVGGAVALRLANYASAVASIEGLKPGDTIPLVASRIAREFYDPLAQRSVEAVSRQTVGKRIAGFVAHAVIPAVPEVTYVYEHNGVQKEATAPGLVWPEGGRVELLRQLAAGSVLAEGETRNRGGKRERRLPVVCPSCESAARAGGGTVGPVNVACCACATIYRSVEVMGDHATLSGEMPDHRAPVEQGEYAVAGHPAPSSPPSTRNEGSIQEGDDGRGDHPAPVEQAEPAPRRRRRDDRSRHHEAGRLLRLLRLSGGNPRLVGDVLDYDQHRFSEKLQGQVSEVRVEIADLLLVERMRAGEQPAPVEQGDDGAGEMTLPAIGGEAGFDRYTA